MARGVGQSVSKTAAIASALPSAVVQERKRKKLGTGLLTAQTNCHPWTAEDGGVIRQKTY